MRSLQQPKSQQKNSMRKIKKRKDAHKSGYNFRNTHGAEMEKLENINEAHRMHKTRNEGSWKLMPKDSCEVYKDRRKRQMVNGKRHQERDRNMSNVSCYSRNKSSKTARKMDKSRNKKKTDNMKDRCKRWSRSDSSAPSYTCSESSMSTSAASTSEMDYE